MQIRYLPGLSLVVGFLACISLVPVSAQPVGMVSGVGFSGIHTHLRNYTSSYKLQKAASKTHGNPGTPRSKKPTAHKKLHRAGKVVPYISVVPQNLVGKLANVTIAPGVVYRYVRGPLNINVIDADLVNAPLQVKPVLAGSTFNRLSDVRDDARQTDAIAAVNANYFKHNGTPLGTLIIDKEWISGPLYDRVSMGITKSGYVKMDRVSLYGTLTSSNPEVSSLWVNNINQPRRTGSKLIVYTRRWGSVMQMAYAGALVAVDSSGIVVNTAEQLIDIPQGGFVLSDTKNSAITKLNRGDHVDLAWHTRPEHWDDVVQAVSGGPMLMKDGKLYVDLKDECFGKSWTGAHICARTAVGVTANNHLLLVTIEGPHTLWNEAKLMQKLGAVDAMNLDGGGSTTMVVNGRTVTRNATASQRRVASALAIVSDHQALNAISSNKQARVVYGGAVVDDDNSYRPMASPVLNIDGKSVTTPVNTMSLEEKKTTFQKGEPTDGPS